jgi:hypothetical protein
VGSPLLGALASARERVALLVREGLGVSAERGSLVLGGGFAAGRCEGFVAWWRRITSAMRTSRGAVSSPARYLRC